MTRIFLAIAILLFAGVPETLAQTNLPNGGSLSATLITENEVDLYSFSAQAGDSVQIRVADTDAGLLFMALELTDPSGTVIASGSNENVAFALCDGSASCSIDESGIYTLSVSSSRPTATGSYDVYYTNVVGAQTDGELINGGVVSGEIGLGDIDAYTFTAQAGDSVQIRVADTDNGNLFPVARLYNPDGSLVSTSSNEFVTFTLCDGSTACTLEQSGTYTLVVDDGRIAFTGNYDVYYTNVDGAQTDGELPNGGVVSGVIDFGDIDAYTFEAQAGDSIQIRVADTDNGNLFPVTRVYNPDGTLLISNSNEFVSLILCDGSTACTLGQSGTYTLVVDDGRIAFTGNYDVYYTNIDGAQTDGALANGGVVSGEIEQGDIDAYTFEALAGDSIQIRIADTDNGNLFPVGRLYNPDGTLLINNSNEFVSLILCDGSNACVLEQSGTYTLVVDDGRIAFTGNYDVYYTNIDGAQTDGELANGGVVSGMIDFGDIDAYTFDAQAGDSIQIRVSDLDNGNLFPVARLYNPDGTLLFAISNEFVGALQCNDGTACALEQDGTYTLIVDDGRIAFTGNYEAYFVKVPGVTVNATLNSNDFFYSTLDRGDLDSYSIDAQVGDAFEIRITDTGIGSLVFPEADLYAPDGTLVATTSGEAVTTLSCGVGASCTVDQTGSYTLVVSDARLAFAGSYVIERDVAQSACEQTMDSDGDQVTDACDNCLLLFNANQIDADSDGAGNACDADISQDCIVNVVDLGALRAAFFSNDRVSDLNTDGVVNVVDLGILRAAFFSQPGPSGVPYCGT
ncbi:MAG: hypothetical protein AB8G16_17595 [Gammaproteobacteria bacterium]